MEKLKREFRIDEEFRTLIPAHRIEEREQLECNLKSDGCREPLVVWRGENILLDGHSRYEICTRLGIHFDVAYKEFEIRDDAVAWMICNQLGRRNLSAFALSVLALRLEDIFKAHANANRGRRTDLLQNSGTGYTPVDTLREVGKLAGVSHDTIAKVKRIRQAAVPELVELVSQGEVSINTADLVSKLSEAKQTKIAVQGACAVRKACAEIEREAKKEKRDKLRAEIRQATADETDESELEKQSQTLRDKCQKEFGTARGQYWEIRSNWATHRLYIGDATNSGDVRILMGKNVASLATIDPPYNRRYVGKTKQALNYGSDDMPPAEFQEFIRQACLNLYDHSKPGAALYVWHADLNRSRFEFGAEDAGWELKKVVVWEKHKYTQSRHGYNWQHEPCLVLYKPGAPQNWWGGHDKSTIWPEEKPHANREHPTSKPVELYERLMEDASRKGDIVVDTFCGSGTAIEAAHLTGRICYAMEKDSGYAAVILKRMERLGLQIRLISGSDT